MLSHNENDSPHGKLVWKTKFTAVSKDGAGLEITSHRVSRITLPQWLGGTLPHKTVKRRSGLVRDHMGSLHIGKLQLQRTCWSHPLWWETRPITCGFLRILGIKVLTLSPENCLVPMTATFNIEPSDFCLPYLPTWSGIDLGLDGCHILGNINRGVSEVRRKPH